VRVARRLHQQEAVTVWPRGASARIGAMRPNRVHAISATVPGRSAHASRPHSPSLRCLRDRSRRGLVGPQERHRSTCGSRVRGPIHTSPRPIPGRRATPEPEHRSLGLPRCRAPPKEARISSKAQPPAPSQTAPSARHSAEPLQRRTRERVRRPGHRTEAPVDRCAQLSPGRRETRTQGARRGLLGLVPAEAESSETEGRGSALCFAHKRRWGRSIAPRHRRQPQTGCEPHSERVSKTQCAEFIPPHCPAGGPRSKPWQSRRHDLRGAGKEAAGAMEQPLPQAFG